MAWVIKDWDKHYENAQSRKTKNAHWIPLPNKHDGKGFRRLFKREDSSDVFTGWILLLQLASKMPKRGILRDEDGDLTFEDMALKTGCSEAVFETAINALNGKEIGWIIEESIPT